MKARLPQRFLLTAHLSENGSRERLRERVSAMVPYLVSWHREATVMEWQQSQDVSTHLEGIHLETIGGVRITSNL